MYPLSGAPTDVRLPSLGTCPVLSAQPHQLPLAGWWEAAGKRGCRKGAAPTPYTRPLQTPSFLAGTFLWRRLGSDELREQELCRPTDRLREIPIRPQPGLSPEFHPPPGRARPALMHRATKSPVIARSLGPLAGLDKFLPAPHLDLISITNPLNCSPV